MFVCLFSFKGYLISEKSKHICLHLYLKTQVQVDFIFFKAGYPKMNLVSVQHH